MTRFTPFRLAVALTSLAALGIASPHPVSAQNLMYTLTGVTFDDGAVASGYFDYNPTTNIFGAYSVITTNGVGDSLVGASYTPANENISYPMRVLQAYYFDTGYGNFLIFNTMTNANSPGVYPLYPGQVFSNGGLSGSGELAPDSATMERGERAIATGSFTVVPLDQTITIGDPLSPDDAIEVTVLEVRGDQVRLGVKAPRTTAVHRAEIYQAIQRENRDAART